MAIFISSYYQGADKKNRRAENWKVEKRAAGIIYKLPLC
jgi:hypothetical protein